MQTTTKDFKCRNCKTIVGKTNGKDLWTHLGVMVPFEPIRVEFNCYNCRSLVRWNRKTILIDTKAK
jgi:uncharacterized UBP type Zn finger protein